MERLERKLTLQSEEAEESRNKAQTMETVPSVVREELERLRAQAGRTEAEGELRAAFNALRDAFIRLRDGLDGAGAGVDKRSFRAAFVTALRLMADQMEGGEKQEKIRISMRQLALGDRKLSWLGSFADEMQRLEEENERLMRDVEKFTGVGQMYESEITRLENAIARQAEQLRDALARAGIPDVKRECDTDETEIR